jgi:hypothetical protein
MSTSGRQGGGGFSGTRYNLQSPLIGFELQYHDSPTQKSGCCEDTVRSGAQLKIGRNVYLMILMVRGKNDFLAEEVLDGSDNLSRSNHLGGGLNIRVEVSILLPRGNLGTNKSMNSL